jgi:predicted phosphate transport protein (TIGR00153 family)
VRIRDKNVDDLYEYVTREEMTLMESSPHDVKPGVYHIILALNLERIADLATNIAEDVIFLTEGRIIRHDEGLGPKKEELSEKVEKMEKEAPCKEATKFREPLECLENHSNYVHQCLEQAHLAVMAYSENRKDEFKAYMEKVIELEKASDLIKRNVRAHVPRGIIMPIDKFELFQFLNEQDDVANTAEDIIDWLIYADIDVPDQLKEEYDRLLKKCLEITEEMPKIIHSARTYFQTGDEDVRMLIKNRIRKLRDKETEADSIEHQIKKEIFSTYKDKGTFPIYFFVRLTELFGRTADHAVWAADILRSMIAR